MQAFGDRESDNAERGYHGSEFVSRLSPEALKEFMAMAIPLSYQDHMVLFQEEEQPRAVYLIVEGEVKLSINSSKGRRLSHRIARKGELLALAAVLSGNPHDMTAETLYPAKLAPIERQKFLGFLGRHPAVYQTVSEELTREFKIACGQLRTVGLSSSAPEKLARLLLDWSENGRATEGGSGCRLSLTHEEIAEFIGASRETVTRTLTIFKNQHLVAIQGSSLTIPSRKSLESCACA
jgi:CRP/FNR family transcriptional regulator